MQQPLTLPAISYLRSLAEGVRADVAASRYLRVDDAVGARRAHREIVDTVRMLSRRRGDPAWRLIGVELEVRARPAAAVPIPSLEEWAESEGLDGWSAEDLLETYRARFAIPAEDAANARQLARAERLRVRRLDLLWQLERAASAAPQPTDRLEGWIDPTLAGRLKQVGLATLADLQLRSSSGERWWRAIPAVGETKARAIAEQVGRLLTDSRVEASATMAVTMDWRRALEQSSKLTDTRLVAPSYPSVQLTVLSQEVVHPR